MCDLQEVSQRCRYSYSQLLEKQGRVVVFEFLPNQHMSAFGLHKSRLSFWNLEHICVPFTVNKYQVHCKRFTRGVGLQVVGGFAQLQGDLYVVWQVNGCHFMHVWMYKFLFSRESGREGVRPAYEREWAAYDWSRDPSLLFTCLKIRTSFAPSIVG